jgi:hypothetical protein
MSWGGHNDDGYVELPSDDFADERYQKERETRINKERKLSLACIKYMHEQLNYKDGPPVTHIDGIPVSELELFIKEQTK